MGSLRQPASELDTVIGETLGKALDQPALNPITDAVQHKGHERYARRVDYAASSR
jgi:hypothetical protein